MSIPTWLKVISPLADIISDAEGGGGGGSSKRQQQPPSYKRGGKVRKTGLARVHKGEMVIPVGRGKKKGRGKKRFGSGRM